MPTAWDNFKQGLSTMLGKRPAPGPTITNTFPAWEQTTPQYPLPSPYPLALNGYRHNEILFACIRKRASGVSEPPARIYQEAGDKEPAVQADHGLRKLLRRPNPLMGEKEFWQATQIYMDIAGFCVWECEFNRMGEPLALWPMRPDFCSFLRGENAPLRAVRYQPWSLPFVDVPIERCLVFMEFDPIYPMLKGLSRSAVALRVTAVDNAATDFLKLFFQNGAVINGLLKTQQSLNEAEAQRIRKLWRAQHGGVENWIDPAVLGSGVEYQQMQMTFKDMGFDAIDGRSEARICQVMETPPILVGAKVGLDRATYANYKEARQAFYEETIFPLWQWYASEITQQCLPWYGEDPNDTALYAEFDVSAVRALAEDRDAKWKRADMGYKGGWATRDEARQEAGLDPIDGDTPVFSGGSTAVGEEIEQEAEEAKEREAEQLAALNEQENAKLEDVPGADDEDDEQVKKSLGEWRRSALDRLKAGQPFVLAPYKGRVPLALWDAITADLGSAKSAADIRAVFERHWPKTRPEPTAADIFRELVLARKAAERLHG